VAEYKLDSSWFEPGGGQEFFFYPHLVQTDPGPTQRPVQWVPGFFPGVRLLRPGSNYQTLSGAEVYTG